ERFLSACVLIMLASGLKVLQSFGEDSPMTASDVDRLPHVSPVAGFITVFGPASKCKWMPVVPSGLSTGMSLNASSTRFTTSGAGWYDLSPQWMGPIFLPGMK